MRSRSLFLSSTHLEPPRLGVRVRLLLREARGGPLRREGGLQGPAKSSSCKMKQILAQPLRSRQKRQCCSFGKLTKFTIACQISSMTSMKLAYLPIPKSRCGDSCSRAEVLELGRGLGDVLHEAVAGADDALPLEGVLLQRDLEGPQHLLRCRLHLTITSWKSKLRITNSKLLIINYEYSLVLTLQ